MTDQAKKFELFYQLISDTYLLYPVKRTAHFSEPEPNDTSLARLKGAERNDVGFMGELELREDKCSSLILGASANRLLVSLGYRRAFGSVPRVGVFTLFGLALR